MILRQVLRSVLHEWAGGAGRAGRAGGARRSHAAEQERAWMGGRRSFSRGRESRREAEDSEGRASEQRTGPAVSAEAESLRSRPRDSEVRTSERGWGPASIRKKKGGRMP